MERSVGPATLKRSSATVLGCGTFVMGSGTVQGEPMRSAVRTIRGRRGGDIAATDKHSQKYFLCLNMFVRLLQCNHMTHPKGETCNHKTVSVSFSNTMIGNSLVFFQQV